MVETNQATDVGGRPFWRRRQLWIGGGVLAGLAVLAAVAPRAWALHGLAGRHGRHAFGARLIEDPAGAKQHAGMAVEWALRGVGASDDQKQEAKRITDRLIDELTPAAGQHRVNREAIARELAKPQIDREALERLRREEVALADQASKAAVGAIVDLAEVLTPEQRRELLAFAHRFHAEGPAR